LDACGYRSCKGGPECGHPSIRERYGEVLKKAVHLLKSEYVVFYGKFGCAVLALSGSFTEGPYGLPGLDECHISVVCLDKWKYALKW
jgi:hypothetical protein